MLQPDSLELLNVWVEKLSGINILSFSVNGERVLFSSQSTTSDVMLLQFLIQFSI